ncbi:helix-turn-helix domain-containing protein [Nevskia ramosa]|uniref:helix-turn-helix domain-containing protein n=1 Tax=Nevskia ramosa TaxID=64002 RepID=UPI00235645A0|nr:helix-turn-helix domain-containing protein [Nevskia ramosa]
MTDQQKAPDAANVSGLGKTQHGNSSEAQRRRLLDRLRIGPISTLDARRELDILMPATRIFELRARGQRIDTIRIDQHTECGKRHNVALYVLQSDAVPPMSCLEITQRLRSSTQPQGASDG